MSDSDRKKTVIGIAAGVTFIISFGIGVQLYEVTNEFHHNERDRNLSQIEVK